MQGSRPARIGDQIREELSVLLQRTVKDPGVGFVTLTFVKVSADLQVARVYYTVLGDDKAKRESKKALERATPFLRRQITQRLRLRRSPELFFQFDESIERGERIESLIQEIHAAERPADPVTERDDEPRDPGDGTRD
jgi:ribosome-binding factor A